MRSFLLQGVVVVAKDIEPGVVYQNGDVKVTAFLVDHAPLNRHSDTASTMPGHPECSPATPDTTKI